MEKKKGISGFVLKMIAVVTMLIDHTAASVFERMLTGHALPPGIFADYSSAWQAYMVMRSIGRVAFPIYCFLLVEGFTYTKDRKKYALRLFLFALISELPFDLALRGKPFVWGYNNVFFTLLLGLLTIMVIEHVFERLSPDTAANRMKRAGVVFLLLLADFVLADVLLHTDYGVVGVLAIVVIYLLRAKPLAAFAAAVLALSLVGTIELWALPGLIPLYFYNGTRGRQAKYFFYAFYPAHLLVLALICMGIGLG